MVPLGTQPSHIQIREGNSNFIARTLRKQSLLASYLEVHSSGCRRCHEISSDWWGRRCSTVEEGNSVERSLDRSSWEGFQAPALSEKVSRYCCLQFQFLWRLHLIFFCGPSALLFRSSCHSQGEKSQTPAPGIPCLSSQWKVSALRKWKAWATKQQF